MRGTSSRISFGARRWRFLRDRDEYGNMKTFEEILVDADELQAKVRHYRWLEEIKREYEDMLGLMEREKDYFTIQSFTYTARGDSTPFPKTSTYQLNPHRSIPYTFIRDGLKAELETICREIEDYKGEIAGVEYNLKHKRHGKVQED